MWNADLQWQHKHTIYTLDPVWAWHWVDSKHLAICMKGCVKVYEVTTLVTTISSRLAYTISSEKWKSVFGKWKYIMSVAVSESLPGTMLVICEDQPYVYEFLCHEATREVTRYKIKSSNSKNPSLIVANASVAIIKMCDQFSFIVCSLPEFTHQSHVQTSFSLHDLSISPDYLLVMGERKVVVRSVAGDMSEDLCEIKLPDGCREFESMCFGDADEKEIYAVCKQVKGECSVYRYTCDMSMKPVFVNTGCVIDGLKPLWYRCLSVTSDGLMAVRGHREIKLYNRE